MDTVSAHRFETQWLTIGVAEANMPEESISIPDVKNIPTLIPEIYYDLIARFPAGCILVGGLVVLLVHGRVCSGLDKLLTMSSAIALGGLVIYITLAYAAGLLLSSCGALLNAVYWPQVFRTVAAAYDDVLVESCKEFGIDTQDKDGRINASLLSRAQCARLYRMGHEYLKRKDLEARLVLPKMQAEAGLVTTLACTVILGFAAYGLIEHDIPSRRALGVGGVLFVAGVASASHRTRRLFERQFSYLVLSCVD